MKKKNENDFEETERKLKEKYWLLPKWIKTIFKVLFVIVAAVPCYAVTFAAVTLGIIMNIVAKVVFTVVSPIVWLVYKYEDGGEDGYPEYLINKLARTNIFNTIAEEIED